MAITLEQANRIAVGALEAAAAEKIFGLTVVVTDAGGCIRTAMRSDGAGNFGIDIAMAKAATALGFGMASAEAARMLGGNPAVVAGLVGATGGRFLPIGGGILIKDEGAVLGAVAVAGSSPENDERFAVEGARLSGFLDRPET
jgi:uncharacterized protein GlcG (DUF336 family)